MVFSLPGLAGVHAAKLVVEANKGEQDHVVTQDPANVENLALVTLKRLPTVTRIPARVRMTKTVLYNQATKSMLGYF